MSKNKLSFLIVFLVEVLAILLAVFGILPREIVLISTGIMVFYFIFSKIEHSLILFIISIPIFVAMPITESFDTMANWRILLVILFLVWFFRRKWSQIKKQIFTNFCCPFKYKIKSNLVKWVIVFLIIGALSIFVAVSPIAAIKKLLFLINIFLLFPIITLSAPFAKLFVSQIIRTFFPTFRVSCNAFLSSHESVTIVSSFSVKSGRFVFVRIPEGYFFVKTLIPVSLENISSIPTKKIQSSYFFY